MKLAYLSLAPVALAAFAGCADSQPAPRLQGQTSQQQVVQESRTTVLSAQAEAAVQAREATGERETAVFAGGCFWCTEADFEKVPGVVEAVSGYTGGDTADPNYRQVTGGGTGHYEAVEVTYDPGLVSYAELVDYYFRTIDPTDPRGQFCDKGSSYRTAVFATPEQIAIARAELDEVKATKPFEADVVTPVLPAGEFYDAEDYHQDYYKKNRVKYGFYRQGCGRNARLEELWGEDALSFRPAIN